MIVLVLSTTDTTTWVGNLIGIPAGVAGIGIPLYLWLSGKIRLASDADKVLEDVQKTADRILNEAKAVADDRIKELSKQVTSITAERDAWKLAHAAEVEARTAASRAAAALLDSAQLSSQLLEVIKEQLAARAKTQEGQLT